MEKRYKVLVCEPVHEETLKRLAAFAEVLPDYERLPEADAVVSRNLSLTREELLRAEKLKVVAIHGTGTDGVDLEAARALGISVFSVPHQNADSVAELIVGLTLTLARRLNVIQRKLQTTGVIEKTPASLCGTELKGKVFGMFGTGEIARRAARIFTQGFGMRAAGYSRSLTREKAKEYGIIYCATIPELLAQADVVSVGLALTKETEGLLGEAEFACMKKTAFLINTARGKIVQEDALYEALKQGQIAGAACDVFVTEPPSAKNKLLTLPNFVATPHIGAHTEEALYRVGCAVAEGIRERLLCEGGREKETEDEDFAYNGSV